MQFPPALRGILLLLLLLADLGDLSALAVRRIKLVIDRTTLAWEPGQPVPARPEGLALDPALVAGLLDIAPGDVLEPGDLDQALRVLRERLDRSGIFSNISVLVIPSRTIPDAVTLMVQADPGFSLRFGGGAAWALAGDRNADGAGGTWTVQAGANRGSMVAGRGLEGLSPLWWRTGAVYTNTLLDGGTDPLVHRGMGVVRGGFRTGIWDGWLELSGMMQADGEGKGPDQGPGATGPDLLGGFETSLGLSKVWFLLPAPGGSADGGEPEPGAQASGALLPGDSGGDGLRLEAGAWLQGRAAFLAPEYRMAGSLGGCVRAKVAWGPATLACQAWADISPDSLPDRYARDCLDSGDRSFRGPVDGTSLLADHFVMESVELRLRTPGAPLGFISRVALDPFLFTDLFQGGRHAAGSCPWFPDFRAAAGPGVRLVFDSPVHTVFAFTFGTDLAWWARGGEGDVPLRLSLAMSAGF